MPEIVSCPKCERKLRVPDDLLGKAVRCPTCKNAFTATADGLGPATPAVAARRDPEAPPDDRFEPEPEKLGRRSRADDEDDDDRPRRGWADEDDYDRPRRRRRFGDWAKVRTGVTLVLIALCVWLGFIVLFSFCGIAIGVRAGMQAARQQGGPPDLSSLLILTVAQAVVEIGLWVLRLIGYGACLSAPPQNGAKGLAVGNLCLAGLAFLLAAGAQVMNLVTGAGAPAFGGRGAGAPNFLAAGAGGLLGLAGGLVWLMQIAVWLFFLRAVGLSVRHDGVVKSATGLLIMLGALVAVGIALAWVAVAAFGLNLQAMQGGGGGGPGGGGAAAGMLLATGLGCVLLVAALAWCIWYIATLVQARGALDR